MFIGLRIGVRLYARCFYSPSFRQRVFSETQRGPLWIYKKRAGVAGNAPPLFGRFALSAPYSICGCAAALRGPCLALDASRLAATAQTVGDKEAEHPQR